MRSATVLGARYKRAHLSAIRFEGCPSRIDAAGRQRRIRPVSPCYAVSKRSAARRIQPLYRAGPGRLPGGGSKRGGSCHARRERPPASQHLLDSAMTSRDRPDRARLAITLVLQHAQSRSRPRRSRGRRSRPSAQVPERRATNPRVGLPNRRSTACAERKIG